MEDMSKWPDGVYRRNEECPHCHSRNTSVAIHGAIRQWWCQSCGQPFMPIDSKNYTIAGVQVQLSGESHGEKDWRNLLRRARRNNYSLLKQVLVDHIKACIKMIKANGTKPPKPDVVLAVDLGCGHPVTYKTYDDIPEQDVPCPCGNPKHWIIRYKDLRSA